MLLASKIPEAKLKPLFDETQWKKVRRQTTGSRGLEMYLRPTATFPTRPRPRSDEASP